jgi:hypothetical protein
MLCFLSVLFIFIAHLESLYVPKMHQLSIIVVFLEICVIVSCRCYTGRQYARVNTKGELSVTCLARLSLAQTTCIGLYLA